MKWRVLVASILILTMLLGCSPVIPVTPSPTQEPPPLTAKETPTPIPPPAPQETPTSTPPKAPQETPSTPTPTPAPTVTPTPSPTPSPTPTGPYTGPLFDNHLHPFYMYMGTPAQMIRLKTGEQLLGYYDRINVGWAMATWAFPADRNSRSWVPTAETIVRTTNTRIVPLLHPSPASDFASGKFTEAVLRQYLKPNGLCQGVGELVLSKPELQSVTLDGPVMQNVFKVVNEIKGIVYIHPSTVSQGGRATDSSEIEFAVSQYPDITFIFHPGLTALNIVAPLMSKYPNIYYSLDVAGAIGPFGRLLYPSDAGASNAESFLAEVYRLGIDNIVENNVRRWLTWFQKYPDRFFWGTDFGGESTLGWHFDESVTDMVMKISREFIGRLPADIQEKYAYQNAQRVFGRFLQSSP